MKTQGATALEKVARQHTPDMPSTGRWCYFVREEQFDADGYIPSIVHEDESGHRPLMGGTHAFAVPYHWGKTFAEAEAICALRNADRGLSERDVTEIVAKNMGLALRRQKRGAR